MKQLNLNVTAEFDRDLTRYMRERKISTKSEAIRRAVKEAAKRSGRKPREDFREWLGIGLMAPQSKKRKFRSEDDLWS